MSRISVYINLCMLCIRLYLKKPIGKLFFMHPIAAVKYTLLVLFYRNCIWVAHGKIIRLTYIITSLIHFQLN